MDGGAARAIRMDPADSVVPVVFVPATPVLTETARGLLPRTVPHVDAAPTPVVRPCSSRP